MKKKSKYGIFCNEQIEVKKTSTTPTPEKMR